MLNDSLGAARHGDWATLTGTVLYRHRIALAADAAVSVQLEDVSKADAPAVILAGTMMMTGGRQVPIPFSLTYNPALINERHEYVVRAWIVENGFVSWRSTSRIRVLTRGGATSNVAIEVQQMVRPL